jgi:ubiquinone/menaquinone biosynthesis C-methylase UbiE
MGHLARLLLERSNSVFGLDLHDLRAVELPFVLGDAGNLPLADKSVDVVLLVTVLHHMDAAMHLEVLKEATRVARRRVVLLEDVYRNRFGKRLTFLLDRLANLDFGPHPHSNRTTPEWKYLLEAVGCHSVGSGEWVMWFLGLPFLHSVIVGEIE